MHGALAAGWPVVLRLFCRETLKYVSCDLDQLNGGCLIYITVSWPTTFVDGLHLPRHAILYILLVKSYSKTY